MQVSAQRHIICVSLSILDASARPLPQHMCVCVPSGCKCPPTATPQLFLCPFWMHVSTHCHITCALVSVCSPPRRGLRAVQTPGRVVLVDGNQMFNRPGPRLVDALEFLVGLLHGAHERIPNGFPWQFWEPSLQKATGAAGAQGQHDAAESFTLLHDRLQWSHMAKIP